MPHPLSCLLLAALLVGCTEPATELPPALGRVEGQLQGALAPRGDTYLFLFPPDGGLTEVRPVPRYVTAVPELRRLAGDGRFRFMDVQPGPWRLFGFLDANGDADLTVDVLAQPGQGDLMAAEWVELEVQARQPAAVNLELGRRLRHALPAFRVEGWESGGVLEVPDVLSALVTLTVLSDGLGVLGEPPRFAVHLVDEAGDGEADDVDGDGLPDLLPRFFLRFLPRPGQEVPVDGQGRPAQVWVPLAFNPAPYLPALQGRVDREVAAESLQLLYVPRAVAITEEPGKGRVVATLPAVPVGEYELWALTAEGGAWWVPNGLAQRGEAPVASQSFRVRVVHADGADGGTGSP